MKRFIEQRIAPKKFKSQVGASCLARARRSDEDTVLGREGFWEEEAVG